MNGDSLFGQRSRGRGGRPFKMPRIQSINPPPLPPHCKMGSIAQLDILAGPPGPHPPRAGPDRQSASSRVGSSDFDIFLKIPYASCVFGLALIS